mmetsp:Transcript_122058/g.379967  ORF Transcript_122058/g.379967 Transcript_122058/m.379967 type:complete len:282 (+) Transcript_122058:177-1022(+)
MVLHAPAIGPLYGGVVAGLLHVVLGPDHLCTIATLSACQGAEAFGFGVRWAGGHITGLILVAVLLAALNAKCSSAAVQAYEHYADYVMGMLLFACGAYFLLSSEKYFDDEWNPKRSTCACHSHGSQKAAEEDEHAPLQPKGEEDHVPISDAGLRRVSSALMGFAQGIACPAGIVGMAFLREYVRSIWQVALFATVFFVVTSLAMGSLAMVYGMLTERFFSSKGLARFAYCASCLLSMTLGLAWLLLTATDCLNVYFGHAGVIHDGHGHHHAVKALFLAAPR